MELPTKLYHYTSQQGLLGILESKKLWMTNILYLNDSTEFVYTLELVKLELKKLRDKFKNLRRRRALIPDDEPMTITEQIYYACDGFDEICSFNVKTAGYNTYVFSLSQKLDDLNQWRGYCPDGGYSIEFDSNKLLAIINSYENVEVLKLLKCIYDKISIEKEIKSLLNSIQTSLKYDDPHYEDIGGDIYLKAIDISPSIKHKSFKSEQEYRIVYQCNECKKKYRKGKSMVIPYIELSLLDLKEELPISKIIVGPTPHPELSKYSIESLLESKGYKYINVESSKIPYRSW